MFIALPVDKVERVKQFANSVLNASKTTIRDEAKLVGLFLSCIPAVNLGEIYYRQVEILKINQALKDNYDNFDKSMNLSELAPTNIQ